MGKNVCMINIRDAGKSKFYNGALAEGSMRRDIMARKVTGVLSVAAFLIPVAVFGLSCAVYWMG